MKIFGVFSYIIAGLLIIYVLNPIDLIPDFIPVVGQSDDAIGLIGVLADILIGYVSIKKSKLALPQAEPKIGNK